MREVRFRAWNKRTAMMEEDFYIHSNGSQYDLAERNYDTPHIEIEKVELEIMRYTGIKDKDGVRIFEGDIVRYFRNELAVIVYRNGGVDIRSLSWRDCEPLQRRLGEIEVIGNIYEHKYLLREEGFSDE